MGTYEKGPGVTKEWEENTPWPPRFFIDVISFWCDLADSLVRFNPPWFKIMSYFSPFLYAPFYLFATYCFIEGKEIVRIPTFIVSSALLYSLIVILGEQYMGEFASHNFKLVLVAYGPYVIFPIMWMWRMRSPHPFTVEVKKGKKMN